MKTHWNHGYTTEAMQAIFSFAATNLGIKRIAGSHAKENLASAKVLEKFLKIYAKLMEVTNAIQVVYRCT